MMATDTKDFVSEMFKQAGESFNQTMSTGLEFQQQVGRFWSDAFTKGFDQFRTQMEKVSKDVAPGATRNVEQFQKMFDEQAKKSLDLLRKTFEAGECCNVHDLFEHTVKMWQTSFDTMRQHMDTLAKTNTELFEEFCAMANKAFTANGHKSGAKPSAKQ